MTILKDLPKEIEKGKFAEFLEVIKRDFPEDRYPELFIQYLETNGKVIILGLGENSACAEQGAQVLVAHPEFKSYRTRIKILRAPKTAFLLR